jgi:glycosyltransferase involved in cell wall biosynthesis
MKRPDMTKVSVIIPTHNRAELLKSAIAGVLNQTYHDFEIIVIDDHSTDNTPEIVAGFMDQRIKYIQNKGKNGPSISRNLGITKAEGEYIAFLDDDDEWFPFKLEKQVSMMDICKTDVCGIYSNRLKIDKITGETYSEDPGADTRKGNLLSQLMIKNPIQTSTLVLRKSCLDKVGLFDENMRYMEDRDLWIRLALHWEFEYIDEPLVKAYYHGNSHLSHNLEGQTQGREILLDRYRHLLKKNKKSWADLYVCLGAQYCQLGKIKKGRRNLLKGISIYPFNPIAFFHLFSSLWGASNYQRIRKYYKDTQLD